MEIKEKYLKNPNVCPYCESTDLMGSGHDYEGKQVWQTITCLDCDKQWRDIFTLTDFEEL